MAYIQMLGEIKYMKSKILFILLISAFFTCSEKHFSNEEWEKHYTDKELGLERILGKKHPFVGHAIVGFDVGGPVDLHYFSIPQSGTGFATMELLKPDGSGPVPNDLGTFELVAFTKLPYDTIKYSDFNIVELEIRSLLTDVAKIALEQEINAGEILEINLDSNNVQYVLIDEYKPDNKQFVIGDEAFGLLLIMKIDEEEKKFADKNGVGMLIKYLKQTKIYPYSDFREGSGIKMTSPNTRL